MIDFIKTQFFIDEKLFIMKSIPCFSLSIFNLIWIMLFNSVIGGMGTISFIVAIYTMIMCEEYRKRYSIKESD